MAGGFDLTKIAYHLKDSLVNTEEPICLPDLDDWQLESDQFDVKVNLQNIKLYEVQGFEIREFKPNYQQSNVDWVVCHDKVTVDCDYQVEGKQRRTKISGEGHAHAVVINYQDSGFATFVREGTKFQISELKMRLSVGRVEFKEEGLQFNSMSPAESKQFLEKAVHQLLLEKERVINDYASARLKDKLNELLSVDTMSIIMSLFPNRQN